jgi:hypothetical protein
VAAADAKSEERVKPVSETDLGGKLVVALLQKPK